MLHKDAEQAKPERVASIAKPIADELAAALDAYLADPSSGFRRMQLEQVLWENKVGLMRCAQDLAYRHTV